MQNFKSFEDFRIDFDDLNILVGINNSGKSTILLGIKACFNFLSELIKERDELDNDSSRTAVDISFLHLPNIKDAWYKKKQRNFQSKIIPIIFNIEFTNGIKIEIHLNQYYGQPHVKIQNSSTPIAASEVLNILKSNPILIPGFVGALVQEELRTSQSVNRVIAAGRHTEILRNTMLQLKKAESQRFRLLSELIEKYFNVKLSKVDFNDVTDEFVITLFKDQDVELDIGLAGSGFLQVLQLLAFILVKKSNIVLLDEPDAHLHPSLQKILIEILTELSKKEKIQFVVSTHSKEIVAQTEPKKIIFIDKQNREGKRISSTSELIEIIGKLGALDHIDLALLMQTKRCLFVEGNDFKILHILANNLGVPIFQGNKQVIPIRRSGENNDRYYDDLTVFRDFIGVDLKAYSIRDHDVKSDEKITMIIQKSGEKFVKTHVWKKHEIENYLIVPGLLERVLNNKLSSSGSGTQISNIREIIMECTDKLKQELEDDMAQEMWHWEHRMGRTIEHKTAQQRAREIISSQWDTLEKRLIIVQGKELLKRINERTQSEYGVSTSTIELASQITREEIDGEISVVLQEINTI